LSASQSPLRLLAVALVLLSLTCTGREARREGEPARRVVVVAIDTLRRDFLSCYGFPQPISPRIDRLAGEGALFTDAVSTAPWTLPAFASLLSGQHPSSHGAGERTGPQGAGGEPPKSPVHAKVTLLPELLRQRAGFDSALFFDNPYLGETWGLSRGFATVRRSEQGGKEAVERALRWIAERRDDDTFVFLHLMEPHLPYEPPEPFAERARDWWLGTGAAGDGAPAETEPGSKIRALYAGEVAYVDHLVGVFVDGLAELGLLDETLLIVTSDHGEEFYEHAEIERRLYNDPRQIWGIGHGHTQYQELIGLPLIVRYPGEVAAGSRVDSMVQIHDLAPSILDWLGLDAPPEMTGTSLLPSLEGEPTRDHVFSEFMLYGDDRRSYREGDLKVILGPSLASSELYDLAADPGEAVNLRDERSSEFQSLARRLLAVEAEAAKLGAAQNGGRGPVSIDQETLDELRALGYIR